MAYYGIGSVGRFVDVEFLGGHGRNFRGEGGHELPEAGLYFGEGAGCEFGT